MARLRSRKVLTGITILMLAMAAAAVGVFLLSLTAPRPAGLGVHNGRLADCPDSPNCVSTQAEVREHSIAPLTFHQNPHSVLNVLDEIVQKLPRTRVIEKTPDYLYVEFRSAFFRFVDDVEFYVEPETGRIQFRSASRVGHSDLGVNRSRMELIRSLFQDAQAASTAMPEPPLDTQPVH